ncbi:MAG: Rossmann fold nucleotide-binding protein [Thermodesulfobacteriota bacterium]
MMRRPPLLTDDGILACRPEDEPILNEALGVPQLPAVMRLEETSDTLRGLLRDLVAAGSLRERCWLIGRSGHSQVGLDVELGEGEPVIHTGRRLVELPILLSSLNRRIPDTLFAELRNLCDRQARLTVARLFIPLSEPLGQVEVEAAIAQHHLLLPDRARIDGDGTVRLPLENIRYLLSTTLLTAGSNAQHVLLQSKEALGLIQHPSCYGLPAQLEPGEFLVSAVHISLGPYLALIERQLNHPEVFHLAARLLDGVRTTGIQVPRQVELFHSGDEAIPTGRLEVRLRLYPADADTARVASRVFAAGRPERIIRDGVDFADATDIFKLPVAEALLAGLSRAPGERGAHGRIVGRNRSVEIPRELEEGEWHEQAQNRIIYEVVRGTIPFGVHKGGEIPLELRAFVDNLESVGGAQELRKVFVSHHFPVTDTLRVLKRNNVGVFVARSIQEEGVAMNGLPAAGGPNIYFGQTTYETFCDLAERDGVRFYMLFGEGEDAHVREFFQGFWVTRGAKEHLAELQMVVAMYGSHVEGTEQVLTQEIETFLAELNEMREIAGRFAVCHGAGPGVMRIADEAAEGLDILRIGIGIDSEKIGQKANLRPPVMVNFRNSARHLRQNLLDRVSLCKIYNIGGLGTLEELLISITNLKLFQSLPAPHIFVDPFGLGQGGEHLWTFILRQLAISAGLQKIGTQAVRLAPAWVPDFCHPVKNYQEALGIITTFLRDPIAYWSRTGIPETGLLAAAENTRRHRLALPKTIRDAIEVLAARQGAPWSD